MLWKTQTNILANPINNNGLVSLTQHSARFTRSVWFDCRKKSGVQPRKSPRCALKK